MEVALTRLERSLRRAPEVMSSLREPVSDADLDELRRAVSPHELPDDLVTLLRWADGQARTEPSPWAPAWPGMHDGSSLLPAAGMLARYRFRRSDDPLDGEWPARLLPIFGEQLSENSIELVDGRPGVLVATPLDGPMWVIAPSLAAVIDATAVLLESGHPLDAEQWTGEGGYAGWYARREAILEAHYARESRAHWPHGRNEMTSSEDWPPHWRP
jgi:hypothetical protein